MFLDSIKRGGSQKEYNQRPILVQEKGQKIESRKRNLLWRFVAGVIFVILVIWIITMKYNFSILGNKQKETVPELERVQRDISQAFEEFNDGLDMIKKQKVYSNSSLSPEEIKKLEKRLFEEVKKTEATSSTDSF